MAVAPGQQVREIFDEASELPAAQRPSYLQRACGQDTNLRSRVETLLAQHDVAGGLLGSGDDSEWAMSPAKPATALHEDDILDGRFRVVRYLGRGGMGEVYEVEDLDLGGRLALKTLRPEVLADSRNVSRFKREIQLARQVTHSNVCRVFDVGRHRRDDGAEVAFLTMELLEGETLAARLKRLGPMTPEEALPLIRQMADGLQALHDANIVHRDFKPGNVMLTSGQSGQTRAVLMDFGVARSVVVETGAFTDVSAPGQVLGTPGYMAPEQFSGGEIGPWTDVYALALVTREIVEGRLPADWQSIVEQSLSMSPDARHDSPLSLGGALTNGGVQRPPSARTPPGWKLARAVALFLTAVALIALGWRVQWQGTPPDQENGRISVAVLPLTVMGDDPTLQPLADGLTGTITQGLSQFERMDSELSVAPTSEIRRAGLTGAAGAKDKLGVDYVVEGTLASQGERVRLTLSVVDTEKLMQTGSRFVEDSRENLLSLQDGAILRLNEMLNLRVQPEALEEFREIRSTAPGAHDFYVQGFGYLQSSDQETKLDSAIELFERSIGLDPNYALPHSGLCESFLAKYRYDKDPAWMDRAAESCERARSLDGDHPEILTTYGNLYLATGRLDQAVAGFQEALQIAPRSVRAFTGLGHALQRLGRFNEAESTLLQAVSQRTRDWLAHKALGLFYYRRGNYEKAIEQYEEVVRLTPDNAHGFANIGGFLLLVGRLDESETALHKALSIRPTTGAQSNLAKLYCDRGEYDAGVALYKEIADDKGHSWQPWTDLAGAYWQADRRVESRRTYLKAKELVVRDLEVNPGQEVLLAQLAHIDAYLGRVDAAFDRVEKLLSAGPSDPESLSSISQTLMFLGREFSAIETAASSLRMGHSAQAILTGQSFRDRIPEIAAAVLRDVGPHPDWLAPFAAAAARLGHHEVAIRALSSAAVTEDVLATASRYPALASVVARLPAADAATH